MTADPHIADLDAALADAGEDIVLRRNTLGPGGGDRVTSIYIQPGAAL